ncbi:putative manganese-dependent inorganic diphosphatase [Mitsuokella sp. oral taxon 131]|uniref:putative manganese-dependent inorganic diphosphatase n=1 Tax=Mitsuokella sp. oral taxon 131 TaxID=1321780 RepID=UPI0003ADD312|nr:putative manganese-dependent inorganic diphosphatase [Mitsuokella sp. oral taxon 131]ERL25521.1 DHHA2 domain protein [Mitsuokella sp. oral taxon 131 str. W9106]
MKNTKPIYTIGHRNPDTDSICSAIGYAHLKQALGENVVPARAGKINAETKYALAYFKVEQPLLLTDLYPRVKDVTLDCKIVVRQHDTLRRLGEVMREHDLKSVPVTDSKGILVGIVTVSDLAKRYFQELGMQNLADMRVRYRDIIAATDSRVLVSGEEGDTIKGNVRIAAGSIQTIQNTVEENDIVIIGDRHDETLVDCLRQGISCLIVSGNGRVSADIIEEAQKRHVFVLSTPYDTYTVARLINQCVPIRRIMHADPVCFKPLDLLSDIKGTMEQTNYRNYPVLENGRLVGIVSSDQLMVPERERVILVDHNERGQAVEGIEEAKILEIIDHHRLGGIQTSEPIYTHAEPVGCTATIIANMHWHRDIDIPPSIAGLLLSAILSDTVLFRSPTCTPYDKKTAERLAEIAGVDVQAYGMDMLKAGSGIGDMTPQEIAKNDLKEFQIGDYRIIVSQISVMDTKEVMDLEDELIAAMTNICEKEGFDMSLVMVTDILEEATYLLYAGSPKTLIGEAFKKDASGTHVYLPGVMSRKKQIIPPLSEAVKRITK